MKLLVVADVYWPSQISAAIELRDLIRELVAQGHDVTMLAPMVEMKAPFSQEHLDGARIVRIKAPQTKDVGLVRRALAEMYLPLALLRGFKLAGLKDESWDGVIWYSPTIFLGLVASCIKRWNACKGYLIVRDLFPDWAVDAGVMRKGLVYQFFKRVERYQYKVADVIGAQTPANVPLVAKDNKGEGRVEVLYNWMEDPLKGGIADCDFDLGNLEGRVIFVYAGNMGVAQDLDAFLQLAKKLASRTDIGFLFVGRGSEYDRLSQFVQDNNLTNVLFMPEVEYQFIPSLLHRCHVGIISLDPRHTTHNIPGKLMAYALNGLPVLAKANPGNDLIEVIKENQIGDSVIDNSVAGLEQVVDRLVRHEDDRQEMGRRAREVAVNLFSPSAVAKQIVDGLTHG